VLCAQEEEAPPKTKEDTPMIRSLRNPLGSHQVLISGRSYGQKNRWKDPKGQTWELLSLQQDCFNRVHEVWVKLPPEWPEDAS